MRLSATVDGLTFSDPPSADGLALVSLDGWFDGVSVRSKAEDRPGQHGSFARQALRGGRIPTISGLVVKSTQADLKTVRSSLSAILADGGFGDLTVTEEDGTSTTASVQVNAAPLVGWSYQSKAIKFHLEFFAPDPLRYGPVRNAPTGFPTQSGGLEFDLFTNGTTNVGYLDFGTPGASGQVTLTNEGTADSWPQFQVTGPTPPFWIVCVETGERLYFNRALSSGETLLIDSATGIVTLNGGGVDYSGLLTVAEFFPVPKQGSCTVAFLPNGTTTAGQLTVIHRPAWW